MSNSTSFRIAYDGEALATHEMNIKDLAPALLAMGEVLEIANKNINGDRVKIQVNLKATDEGSVDVALIAIQGIWNSAVSLFDGTEANAIVNAADLLGYILGIGSGGTIGVVGLIKWLKGRKIKNVTRLEHGNLKIELQDGEAKVVEEREIQLFSLISIRKRIEAVVKPLNRNGVESVNFSAGDEQATITKKETKYFKTPELEEEVIDDKEYEENLTIVNISFQDDGKWKFYDGSASFFAEIEDEEFLEKVKRNEKAFAHDDILHVKLRRVQSLINGTIKSTFTVVNVLDHRSAAIQIKLPFSEE